MTERVFQVKRKITIEGEHPEETKTTPQSRGSEFASNVAIIIVVIVAGFFAVLIGLLK